MCNFASGRVVQDIIVGDVKEINRSPGLQHQPKLSRWVMKQQLEELLLRSDIMIQNSIRLQIMSQNLLEKNLRLQDLCVHDADNDSISEKTDSKIEDNQQMPMESDSVTHQNDSMTQDSESMTSETSFGSRSC